jgi:hypothetical protein
MASCSSCSLGTHDRLGADVAAATRPVVDNKLLAEPLRQPLSDQACPDVEATTGREANDNAHRPRWIGLRPRDARQSRQRGRARGEAQKLSAGKFHRRALRHHELESPTPSISLGVDAAL